MVVLAANAYVDPVLAVMDDGETHSIADLQREVVERLQSSPDDLHDPMHSGKRTRHRYHVYMAVAYLFQAGLVERSPEGLFRITPNGRAVLANANRPIGLTAPEQIDAAKPSTPGEAAGLDTSSSSIPPSRQAERPLVPPPNQRGTAAVETDMHQAGQDGQGGSENHGSDRKRRPIRILLIWTGIFTVLGLLCFWGGYDRGPTRPTFPDGGILVFVNEPHESADIYFIVDTKGDFSVSVSGNGTRSFLVIASGSAAVEPVQNTADLSGSWLGITRGIRIDSVGTSRGTATGQGTEFQTSRHHQFQINGYAGDGDVTAAKGYQNPKNITINSRYIVYGKLHNPIVSSSSSGSVELGQLPLIGAATSLTQFTPAIHATEPISGPITIAGHIPHSVDIPKWYAPTARVHIAVTSSPDAVSYPDPLKPLQPLLPPGYKLDSAGPSTVNSNELLWQAAGNVGVTWDLTNLSAARQASVWLFFSGILFGIAASFLGVLTDRLLEAPEERSPNKGSGQAAS